MGDPVSVAARPRTRPSVPKHSGQYAVPREPSSSVFTIHSDSSDHIFTQMLLSNSESSSQIPYGIRSVAYSNFEDQFLSAILCFQSIEDRR